jgi:hypothetical protein
VLGSVLMGFLVVLVGLRWAVVIYRTGGRGDRAGSIDNRSQLGGMSSLWKHCFYACLLCTPLFDMPMYFSFSIYNEYYLIPYSFHKLAPSARLAALSITISNWRKVLFDLEEYSYYPNLLGSAYLFGINVIVGIFSVINFALCYSSSSFSSFLHNPAYVTFCFVMIICPLFLTVLMLRAGLTLSYRLQVLRLILKVRLFRYVNVSLGCHFGIRNGSRDILR